METAYCITVNPYKCLTQFDGFPFLFIPLPSVSLTNQKTKQITTAFEMKTGRTRYDKNNNNNDDVDNQVNAFTIQVSKMSVNQSVCVT